MGGLLHLVQQGGAWEGCGPTQTFLAVSNITAHPSTASVPTSYHLMWHYMPLGSKGLNECPVMDGQCTVMPRVSRGTTGSATDSAGGECGKLGEGGEAISLPLPNVPATSGQHFTIAPCTSPITLFSMYNVTVVSQSPSL